MAEYEIIDGKWHHRNQIAPSKTARRIAHRAYAAAAQDRLTASFLGSGLSIDEALRRDLRKIRFRSRQLCMDNDYARKFIKMCQANVVGVRGIRLQARTVWPDGKPDAEDNAVIERAWNDWAKPRHCSICKTQSLVDIMRTIMAATPADGEILVRLIAGANNPYNFALQLIEADHLDENYNEVLGKGRRIVMGVEKSEHGEPLAYHLFTRHPGENSYLWGGKHYDRVPAKEIIHLHIKDRPGQSRGLPWLHTAIRRLNMLGGYEEAELVAARVGASKMGFFTSADGDTFAPDDADSTGREYDDAELITQADPGTFHQLPDGTSFTTFDPQHPTAAFADFTKAVLRGAASGLNVAYNTLANDLEGVNFSSIRSGVLEEREQWRALQNWLIEHFCEPVYNAWLANALTTQALPLPAGKMQKYKSVVWQPRGFDWVDPLKDIKANTDSVALGVATRADIAAAKGQDLREIFEQLKLEQELASEYGISIAGGQAPMKNEANDNDD